MKVRWTEQALARLAEIETFVARDDVNAALRLTDRLIERGAALSRFPRSGRRVPEFPDSELREVVERSYRIVYRVSNNVVEILTVFEGHRRFPRFDVPGL